MKNQLSVTLSGLLENFCLVFSLFAIEVAALTIIRLPASMQFDVFAFSDPGANLTAQYLIDRGYRPVVDFGYLYGLLGLLAGRVWFALTGRTPWSYEAAMCAASILIVWALARIVTVLRPGLPGLILVLLTMPILVPGGYPAFAHALEAVLLYHALAAHVRGRRSTALALTAVCVLAKPSIAYFYGLFLIVFIALDRKQQRTLTLPTFVRALLPAAAALLLTAAALATIFGVSPLAHTILPLAGRKVYAASHFGFFQSGRAFWAPPQATVAYYLESVAGFWLTATAALFVAAFGDIAKLLRGNFNLNDEFILNCGLLQFVFITVLWGTQFSWIYYSWILILGLTAAAKLGSRWRWTIACLALFLPAAKLGRIVVLQLSSPRSLGAQNIRADATERALASVSQSQLSYRLWFTTSRSPTTANLWASDNERVEWVSVLNRVRGRRAALLAYDGCASLLYPDLFMPPAALYLTPGLPTAGEIQRELAQLRSSSIIVMVPPGLLRDRPEFASLLETQFRLVPGNSNFAVYDRNGTPGSASVP